MTTIDPGLLYMPGPVNDVEDFEDRAGLERGTVFTTDTIPYAFRGTVRINIIAPTTALTDADDQALRNVAEHNKRLHLERTRDTEK